MNDTKTTPDEAPTRRTVAELLRQIGLGASFQLHAVAGGRNNRVFRLDVNRRRLLLKWYFADPDDARDRRKTEFDFCQFAWNNGVTVVPQPLAATECLAAYSWIDGKCVLPREVQSQHVQAALDFYRALNRHRNRPAAERLALASEACFSIENHLACVGRRLEGLGRISPQTDVHRRAIEFVRERLLPAFERITAATIRAANRQGIGLDSELERRHWCLSPSDFGFHNALLDDQGRLHFVDFEYAGWDDPAKLVCDFFCQVEVPVPRSYFDLFAKSVLAPLDDQETHRRRIELLFPVYQLKWCCILLNEFLPAGDRRRRFGGAADLPSQRAQQLDKARQALESIPTGVRSSGSSL